MIIVEDGIVSFTGDGVEYYDMFAKEDHTANTSTDIFVHTKRMVVHRDFVEITKRHDYSTIYVPIRFIKYMEES